MFMGACKSGATCRVQINETIDRKAGPSMTSLSTRKLFMASLYHTPVLTVSHLALHDSNNIPELRSKLRRVKNANYSTVTDREPFSSVVDAVSIEMLFFLRLLPFRDTFPTVFSIRIAAISFPSHASQCPVLCSLWERQFHFAGTISTPVIISRKHVVVSCLIDEGT